MVDAVARTMIAERPSPVAWLAPTDGVDGVETLFERHADYRFYGYGKGALADALAPLATPGETALLPAYLPDAVAEPFADVGLEPEYYAVTARLAPNTADLAERVGEATGAVVSVDYFGFPAPEQSTVARLADEFDCLHVDNASHSAFSVVDGTLLGTRGDLGFTSLWKLLPVPDGACLFLDDAHAGDVGNAGYAGCRDGFTAADWRSLAQSGAKALLEEVGVLRPVEAAVNGGSASVAAPSDRYEASKVPMSRLSRAVLARTDPAAVRGRRRANYAAWDRGLAERADLAPVFDELTPGVCPQVYPVRADVPRRLLSELRTAGVVGADTWPRLPGKVRTDPAYRTARRLADEVVTLPVHQQVRPAEITEVCRALTA